MSSFLKVAFEETAMKWLSLIWPEISWHSGVLSAYRGRVGHFELSYPVFHVCTVHQYLNMVICKGESVKSKSFSFLSVPSVPPYVNQS
jgi:hypothetical protein